MENKEVVDNDTNRQFRWVVYMTFVAVFLVSIAVAYYSKGDRARQAGTEFLAELRGRHTATGQGICGDIERVGEFYVRCVPFQTAPSGEEKWNRGVTVLVYPDLSAAMTRSKLLWRGDQVWLDTPP